MFAVDDHPELKKLTESLNRAIEQAEHKPGQWAETAQSMGGICCAGEPFQIGKPWTKEDPWAHFSYKRDSWLAVAAVNALPQLMALIAENDRLSAQVRLAGVAAEMAAHDTAGRAVTEYLVVAQERDQLKAEIAGLKTGYEAYEQVNAGLKVEVEALRKDAERYRWLRIADWWRSPVCVIRNPKEQAKLGSDCPSGDRLDAAIDATTGKGEQT
ncbi:hypothetical protein ACI2JG_24035 [Pseudomonas psychrophila]|uniref:hypothetical protein n=1 Tax=Pseudomonas psychrophila TaxID=122355 RepID=UPI00384BD538